MIDAKGFIRPRRCLPFAVIPLQYGVPETGLDFMARGQMVEIRPESGA
jgi:hypothetical protein